MQTLKRLILHMSAFLHVYAVQNMLLFLRVLICMQKFLFVDLIAMRFLQSAWQIFFSHDAGAETPATDACDIWLV